MVKVFFLSLLLFSCYGFILFRVGFFLKEISGKGGKSEDTQSLGKQKEIERERNQSSNSCCESGRREMQRRRGGGEGEEIEI